MAEDLFKMTGQSYDMEGIQIKTDECLKKFGYERIAEPSYNNQPTSTSSSTESRLNELSNLREKGLITEEEYNQKKSDILKDL